MRTIATFHSVAFNVAEPRPEFLNPDCFGDDVARWLIARLRAAGATTSDEPGQEDFGWYLDFEVPEGRHCCVVGLRPADDGEPPTWVLWVERSRGFLASIVGLRERGLAPAALRTLHDVLASAPEVSALRWHRREDFDHGREELAAPEP